MKRCFACHAPAYFKKRLKPSGMGLWCSGCHIECGYCACDEQEIFTTHCENCGHNWNHPRPCKEDYDGQPCNCGGKVVIK